LDKIGANVAAIFQVVSQTVSSAFQTRLDRQLPSGKR
jgi:hypothetical protein